MNEKPHSSLDHFLMLHDIINIFAEAATDRETSIL